MAVWSRETFGEGNDSQIPCKPNGLRVDGECHGDLRINISFEPRCATSVYEYHRQIIWKVHNIQRIVLLG